MGSVGFLLADWSIELIRSKKRKAKRQQQRAEGRRELAVQTEETPPCPGCTELPALQASLVELREERAAVAGLLEGGDLVVGVTELAARADEAEQLRREGVALAEGVAVQLRERDSAHTERVRSLEILMAEKEKQLLAGANLARQQLAEAQRELQQQQQKLAGPGGQAGEQRNSRELEQELHSLLAVLDLRKDETDKLKAMNNGLELELERCAGLEVRLQVERQKAEELGAVVKMKNEQLRQVLDEYDSIQHQLEIEVSAHTACQQELERSQWDKQNFLVESEKRWKEVENQKKSGLILDVVQKDKAVAYSFNC